MRSFRLRIALLSAALAGSALVGFSAVAWQLIYVAKVNRLDAKLETLVRRAARPRPQNWWEAFAATIPRELGTDSSTPTVLLVVGADGPLYRWSTAYGTMETTGLRPTSSTELHSTPQAADFNLPPPLPPDSLTPAPFRPLRPFSRLPDIAPQPLRDRLPDPRIVTQRTTMGTWRVGTLTLPGLQTTIAVSLQAIDQEMAAIRNIFLIAIPGTLLLIAGGAWLLSGSALRPIRKLTAAIQEVTVTGLDRPVPIGTADVEFIDLIQGFNQMLERLERSFKQASRFSGDAAHELKTPLAILQGELEQALQQAESGSAEQQTLGNLLDEVRRLSGIVRKLLLLSLADAGQMSVYKAEVNLSELLEAIVEDLELLAPHLDVQPEIAPDLRVWGDRDLINQILQNLVSNAIKYNLPDGWIKICAQQQQQAVQVTLSNASNTIPPEDRSRIFDRFYRSDPARTRKIEGVGLGLSLSREIARAHRGDLTLDPTPPQQTALTLTLPTTRETADRASNRP